MPVQSILALKINFQSCIIMLNLRQTYTFLLDSSCTWMVHKHKILFHNYEYYWVRCRRVFSQRLMLGFQSYVSNALALYCILAQI